jgi:hypothetical protein
MTHPVAVAITEKVFDILRRTLMIYLLCLLSLASAQSVRFETGISSVIKNEFRVPKQGGTDVQFPDSSQMYYRVEGSWDWNERHGLRFVVAPFSYSEKINTTAPIVFDKTTFASNTETSLNFKFNSYRLGYVYHWIQDTNWTLDVGGTLKVRDALISVEQAGVEEKFTDFGFVPLLYLKVARHWNELWSTALTADGAGSPQGYAVDALIDIEYRWREAYTLSLGYRLLDGGADNDTLKTFSTIQYLSTGLNYSF